MVVGQRGDEVANVHGGKTGGAGRSDSSLPFPELKAQGACRGSVREGWAGVRGSRKGKLGRAGGSQGLREGRQVQVRYLVGSSHLD